MAWVRLDDAYYDHPKLTRAGPLAELLWVRGLAWSNRNLSDGYIPDGAVLRLAIDLAEMRSDLQGGHQTSGHAIAEDLVAEGCWDAVDGGYRIHDYHDYQRDSTQIRGQREDLAAKRAAAGRAGAAARWAVDNPPSGDISTNGKTSFAIGKPMASANAIAIDTASEDVQVDDGKHGKPMATGCAADSKAMAPTPTPTPTSVLKNSVLPTDSLQITGAVDSHAHPDDPVSLLSRRLSQQAKKDGFTSKTAEQT